MSLNQRFNKLLETTGISQTKLAKAWGVTRQQVNNLARGTNPIGLKIVKQILDYWPSLNANWLIGGVGEMWLKDSKLEKVNEDAGQYISKDKEMEKIRNENIELLKEINQLHKKNLELTEKYQKLYEKLIDEKRSNDH
jgi:transcriptional regulator with XRE-family HTH domain